MKLKDLMKFTQVKAKPTETVEIEIGLPPMIPWYEIEPFDNRNDPYYGISSSERFKLIQEFQDVFKPSERGVEGDQKFTPEHKVWSPTKSTADLQFRLVAMYSEDRISLRNKVQLNGLPILKRGTKGNLLSMKALEELPEQAKETVLFCIQEKGCKLVHAQGYVMTLPEERFKYCK